MPIQGYIGRAFGRGLKIFAGTYSITGTGAVTVSGATAIVSAVASVTGGSTVTNFQFASIVSYATNIINLVVANGGATSTVISATPIPVDVWALVS